MIEIGDNLPVHIELSNIIKSMGISKGLLAERCGVVQSMISNVLSGKKKISVKIAIGLEALHIRNAEYWLIKQVKQEIEKERNL